MTLDEAKTLKNNIHLTFESPQGKETMKFMKQIGSWWPHVSDSMDTNAIVARDANRRLLGTIRTIMDLTPEQILTLINKE